MFSFIKFDAAQKQMSENAAKTKLSISTFTSERHSFLLIKNLVEFRDIFQSELREELVINQRRLSVEE